MMKLFLVVIVSALASATAAPGTGAPTTEAPTTGSPTGAPTIATYELYIGGKGMNCATGFHLEDENACKTFAVNNNIEWQGSTASSLATRCCC